MLPLVQFYLEEGISDEEAVSLIDLEVPHMDQGDARWQDMDNGGILWSEMELHTKQQMTNILCELLTRHPAGSESLYSCPDTWRISPK